MKIKTKKICSLSQEPFEPQINYHESLNYQVKINKWFLYIALILFLSYLWIKNPIISLFLLCIDYHIKKIIRKEEEKRLWENKGLFEKHKRTKFVRKVFFLERWTSLITINKFTHACLTNKYRTMLVIYFLSHFFN